MTYDVDYRYLDRAVKWLQRHPPLFLWESQWAPQKVTDCAQGNQEHQHTHYRAYAFFN